MLRSVSSSASRWAISAAACAEIEVMEIAEVAHMRVIPAGGGWPTAGAPEDDARLIAAAPWLYEALRLMLASHDATCAGEECQLCGVDLARAAIAKAEGR